MLIIILMLAGCAVAPERPEWPSDLPSRAYFESLYAGDLQNQAHQSRDEYFKWVKAFYRGWGGLRGWHSIREEILTDVDAAERKSLRLELDELGPKISGEWAKAYNQRAIDSKTLQVWVDAVYEASERRDYQRFLKKLSADVEALLGGALDPSAITLNRYYPDAVQHAPITDAIIEPD